MSIPQPMDKLHDGGTPPFLTKTYDIVNDPTTDQIISWSNGNNSFIVWDSQTFSIALLPRYFKHSNFSSFIRQLNTYGFRKVDADRWEFANEGFLRGKKHLLKNIRRRKSSVQPAVSQSPSSSSSHQSLEPCAEVGIFGLDVEIDRLKRDKKVLMVELVKLRQQQQTSRICLEEMEQRLLQTETKQRTMMNFLAKAMKNPDYIHQMLQNNDTRKELEEEIKNKRRRPLHQGGQDDCDEVGGVSFVKVEPQDIDEFETFDIHEGVGGATQSDNINIGYHHHFEDQRESLIDDGLFWEGLLSEGNEERIGLLGIADEGVEDVDVLTEQLGYLGSSSSFKGAYGW